MKDPLALRIGRKWHSGNEDWVAAGAGARGAGERMGAKQRKVVREGLVCLPGAPPRLGHKCCWCPDHGSTNSRPWGPSLCL